MPITPDTFVPIVLKTADGDLTVLSVSKAKRPVPQDATREEAIEWCRAMQCDFQTPVFPPPAGWMWCLNKVGVSLDPVYTITDQGGSITQADVCGPVIGRTEWTRCNRNGCAGVMLLTNAGNCTCFLGSPCWACLGRRLECTDCCCGPEDDSPKTGDTCAQPA